MTTAIYETILRAVRFFEGSREPNALIWLAWLHRRFGIEELAFALPRYDEVARAEPAQLPLRRLFRRIADRDSPIRAEDLEAVTDLSDRIMISALYCDRFGLPASFPEVLQNVAKAGSYYLPHVVLTWVWIRSNGCQIALPEGFIDGVLAENAAMVNKDPTTVTDLKLEAAAFLHLAGQGALVDGRFIQSVLASQRDDGGWGLSPDGEAGSYWHSSILALLLLAHVAFGYNVGRSEPPANPGRSGP